MDLWLPPKPAIIIPGRHIERPVGFKPDLIKRGMLPGLMPLIPTASAAAIISNSFVAAPATITTPDGATFTFTSANIGTADATRRVVVGVVWMATASSPALTSATIGGTGTTIHVQTPSDPGAGGISGVALFSTLFSTGTTATIVVNLAASCTACAIGVWRQINESVASPNTTASATAGSLTATTSINVPSNGSLYSVTTNDYLSGAFQTYTWTAGATERFDQGMDTSGGARASATGASETGLGSQTGRTLTNVLSGGTSPANGIVAMTWV